MWDSRRDKWIDGSWLSYQPSLPTRTKHKHLDGTAWICCRFETFRSISQSEKVVINECSERENADESTDCKLSSLMEVEMLPNFYFSTLIFSGYVQVSADKRLQVWRKCVVETAVLKYFSLNHVTQRS